MTRNVDYILTTFSPTMFGGRASIHIETLDKDNAAAFVGEDTAIVATRASHENMAKNLFGDAQPVTRFADCRPGRSALVIHYRGSQVPDDGTIPADGVVTIFRVDVEDFIEE